MLTAAWLLPCAPKYGAAFCQHDTEADILLELVDPASNKAPKDPAFMPYNAQDRISVFTDTWHSGIGYWG
eukprot:gene27567-34007_t